MQLNWEPIKTTQIFPGESGGDYGALLGFQNRPGGKFADIDLTNMTVDEAIAFANSQGDYAKYSRGAVGRMATPMGAYQIVGTTLKGLRDSGRISGDTKLDEDAQDYLGQVILSEQGSGAWEGWRGKSIKPGQYEVPATFAEYKALREPVSREFLSKIEGVDPETFNLQQAAADTGLAGKPREPGLFGMFDVLASTNTMPRQRPDAPGAKPDNPANPAFADNAVGPLAEMDMGRPIPRTVAEMLSGAPEGSFLPGGPAERALAGEPNVSVLASGQALPNPAQSASASADVGGLFGPQPFDYSAVQPTQSAGLELGSPIGPEVAERQTMGPPRRLGPRGEEPPQQVASRDFDETFGLFGPQAGTVATSDVEPDGYYSPFPSGVVDAYQQFAQSHAMPQAAPPTAQQAVAQPTPQMPALEAPVSVAPRVVAAPRKLEDIRTVTNAVPDVAKTVDRYGLDPNPEGAAYGFSPWGSGIAKVYDSADERTKIAASGPGLFGAFNNEFGTNIGLSPGRMAGPLATTLGIGAAMAGAGPLGMAIPAASALGGANWLANRMDIVPRSQRQSSMPQNQGGGLFGGIGNFFGGLFGHHDVAPTPTPKQSSGGSETNRNSNSGGLGGFLSGLFGGGNIDRGRGSYDALGNPGGLI